MIRCECVREADPVVLTQKVREVHIGDCEADGYRVPFAECSGRGEYEGRHSLKGGEGRAVHRLGLLGEGERDWLLADWYDDIQGPVDGIDGEDNHEDCYDRLPFEILDSVDEPETPSPTFPLVHFKSVSIRVVNELTGL